MTLDEWVKFGYAQGWVSPPVCQTHDGTPMSKSEDDAFNTGDPCIRIMRLYDNAEHKGAIERDHAPSVWRASNEGS
jgi:hypothetical protein